MNFFLRGRYCFQPLTVQPRSTAASASSGMGLVEQVLTTEAVQTGSTSGR